MNNDNNNDSTTAGKSYSYNIPKEYKSTTTSAFPCYKTAKNYGACQAAQIVPPSPTSPMPELFRCMKPHPMPKQNFTTTGYVPKNRNYYNKVLYGSPAVVDSLANQNSNDNYRVISMPNQALSCGGLGKIYNPTEFKPGFNDISQYNYYR